MLGYVIKILSLADGRSHPLGGRYILRADVDAITQGVPGHGRGLVKGTDDPDEAKRFDTQADAMIYWQQQSKQLPLRPDGEPNRPLTAYTVIVEPLQEVQP